MYDLRRLRSLCAIADHGSLTGAAAALDFTQPAVSQHLAALEAEVGAPLVNRSRGGAELTAAGALLVEHARAALDRLALAELQVGELIASEQRRVRLAANSSALTRLVPLAVAELRRRLPDAEVTITRVRPAEGAGEAAQGRHRRRRDVPPPRRRGARRRRGAHAARGADVRGRAAPPPARGRGEHRARRAARRRLDPGPVRDLARADPRGLPRGGLRAPDRLRERRPARHPRDRRRRPGGQPGPIA